MDTRNNNVKKDKKPVTNTNAGKAKRSGRLSPIVLTLLAGLLVGVVILGILAIAKKENKEHEHEIQQLQEQLEQLQNTEAAIEHTYAPTVTSQTEPPVPEYKIPETEPQVVKPLISADVGDVIHLGSYPRGDSENPIGWRVLTVTDGKALLISQEGLDAIPYHAKDADVTWDSCSLRVWLNEIFYYAAFSDEEREWILTTDVSADKNPEFPDVDPGYDTSDKVFLLSIDEVLRYMPEDRDRLSRGSFYAIQNGAFEDRATGSGWWMLRTPGEDQQNVMSTNSDGSLDYDGGTVSSPKGMVRPAMWIKVG